MNYAVPAQTRTNCVRGMIAAVLNSQCPYFFYLIPTRGSEQYAEGAPPVSNGGITYPRNSVSFVSGYPSSYVSEIDALSQRIQSGLVATFDPEFVRAASEAVSANASYDKSVKAWACDLVNSVFKC